MMAEKKRVHIPVPKGMHDEIERLIKNIFEKRGWLALNPRIVKSVSSIYGAPDLLSDMERMVDGYRKIPDLILIDNNVEHEGIFFDSDISKEPKPPIIVEVDMLNMKSLPYAAEFFRELNTKHRDLEFDICFVKFKKRDTVMD